MNLAAATGFGIGSYNLITPPTGAWGSAPAVSLSSGTVPTTLLTYAYSASTSAITLTTARSATMGAFNWTGGATGNWSPWANWQVGGVSYAGVYPGMVGADTVTIDLTAQSSPTITMDAALSVASLTLNNAGTLTLNGANALTVSSALSIGASQTVQGSGTINGPVTVAGGTINGAAWGGSVGMSSGSISGGAFSGALTASGGTISAGTFNNTAAISGATVSGGTFNGALSVSSGTVGGGTFNSGVTATGGTFSGGTFGSASACTFTVNSGSAVSVNAAVAPYSTTVSTGGNLQGTGTISSALALSGTLGGTLDITGNVTSTGGTFTPSGGNLTVGGACPPRRAPST